MFGDERGGSTNVKWGLKPMKNREAQEQYRREVEKVVRDLNLRSAFYAVRSAIPHMIDGGWGRIVLVGSRAVVDTPPGQAAFNIAKAGVVALGKSLAQELDGTGVTAAVLMPSVIDTPATREALPFADYVDWPTPDEIAGVAAFLVGEEAGVMNGATIPVYGRA